MGACAAQVASSTTSMSRAMRRSHARRCDGSDNRCRARRHGTTSRTAPTLRQRLTRPIMDDLAAFLDAPLATISGRSELAKAIRYARSRTLEISNNAAERAIRPLALGRKNHLFAGSDGGAMPPRSTPLLKPSSSNASIPNPTCARCSAASPIIRSTASSRFAPQPDQRVPDKQK
jgi:hypothetical protein